MRYILLITIIAFSILSVKEAFAQTGSITTDGVYVPRMNTTSRDAISNPTSGQMIYNTDDDCFNVYQGNAWIKLCGFNATTINKLTQKANFGGGNRGSSVGFSIGSKGYIGTGSSNGGAKNDFWEYNPANNTWTQKADFGGGARIYAVGFSIGNKGYVGIGIDGSSKDDFWEYNPADNTWTQKANFGGGIRTYAVGFSIGNKGYIGTGSGNGVTKNDFWEYNPTNNTWTQKADFGGGVRRQAVGFSIGTKGYIGTGYGNSQYKDDFWEYDPANNTWTQKTNFGGGNRTDAVGFSIGSKGYVGTGYKQIVGSLSTTTDFWEYNPSTNDWIRIVDILGGVRINPIGFSIGSKGYIGTGYDSNTLKDDFWEYNPNIANFTEQGNTFNGVKQLVQTDSTGKVLASVLPANTTIQGNTFNGLSQLVQTDGTGKMPVSVLPATATTQGNTFNGADQLIKLDATGNLTINGNISNQSYVAPTLQNGWINYIVSPGHAAAGYYKDKESIVRLKGLIRGGTTTSSTVLFTLPAGYRPAEIMIFAVVNGNAFGRVDVYPSGEVRILSGGNDFLSLDGITFRVN